MYDTVGEKMAFYSRTPITVIEFGTDKIAVLHGQCDREGHVEILAFSQAPSEGAVQKGLIVDFNKALQVLSRVLEQADRALPMGAGEHKNVYFLLNGSVVTSSRGEGTVMIYDDGKVHQNHIDSAVEKALSFALPQGQVSFGSYDSFFVINRANRVKDPKGQFASQLDVYIHILACEKKYLDDIRRILRELGFDHPASPVFNGIASIFSVLSQDERERGTLLIDFGSGACDYVLICMDGIYLSGVLPLGVNHIANDLAIGLDLPYDFCVKFLRENKLSALRAEGRNFLEYTEPATGKRRQIPLDSFEKIMDLRLREIYSIIHAKINEKRLQSCINAGIVVCGGGAMLDGSLEIAKNVFTMPVRMGEPQMPGAGTGFTGAASCYASLLGVLHFAAMDMDQQGSESGLITGMLSSVMDSVVNPVKTLRKVFGK